MALTSFFFSADIADTHAAPPYEVEGPLKKGDPVHENLTLLVLRQAIELRQNGDSSVELGPLLKKIDLKTLPNWDSEKQHKFDPKDSPESTQEFLRGVYWPDDPRCYFFKTIRGVKKYTMGVQWYLEFRAGKKGKNRTPAELIARSHFGDLQFLHAMACKTGEPAKETKEKILFWSRVLADVASGRTGPKTFIKNIPDGEGLSMKRFFSAHWDWTIQQLLAGDKQGAEELSPHDVQCRATGVLLHLIQDSYAAGHVDRTDTGTICQFHDYSQQDSHKHGHKDKMGPGKQLRQHIENIPGAMQAIAVGAHVVFLLDSMAETDDVVNYLREQVFKLDQDVQSAGPGDEFSAKRQSHRTGFRWAAQTSPTDFPGAWRGSAETGEVIAEMIRRLRASKAAGITLKGDTAESLFTRAILNNKHVTNDMILSMAQVKLAPPETDSKTAVKNKLLVMNSAASVKLALDIIPNARFQPVHKFTVALMSAATAINDEDALSENFPDFGMGGHQGIKLYLGGKRFFWLPKTERVQRSTALHDFTDYLRGAGIEGLNKAVFHIENRMFSALNSILPGFDRY